MILINLLNRFPMGGWFDGEATLARFDQPLGLCVDSFERLWVSDTANNRIRQIAKPHQREGRRIRAHTDTSGGAIKVGDEVNIR